jgi:hypothetical protein
MTSTDEIGSDAVVHQEDAHVVRGSRDREIANRPPQDPIRVTLDYMLAL